MISVNWDFIAYLNGAEVGRGQFPDYADQKTYTEIDLGYVPAGEHVLSVLVYNGGYDFSASLKAPAGLWAKLAFGEYEIPTDALWKCCLHPAFASGVMPMRSAQLGFTTSYDARLEEDLTALNYDDLRWSSASINAAYKPKLSQRPLSPIPLGKRVESRVDRSGWLRRDVACGTFAEMVSADQYSFISSSKCKVEHRILQPPEPFNGACLIYDFGKEYVGFIEVELFAKDGTVIDISHGEHLDDGIVRAKLGDRNFTDRYVCRDGWNTYHLPFSRVGARYLQLNLTNMTGDVEIAYAGIRKWDLPLPEPSAFECDYPMASRLREVGLHTLRMCMHDHYEDCPWREQALYAYDSRNQMTFGYYAWGNYDFAAASLDLLGRGLGDDGHLNLCAPTHRSIVIPAFSYVWVSALYEHYLYSGSDALLRKFKQQLKKIVTCALALMDSSLGLFRLSRSGHDWNFYEWVDGLDGGMHGGLEAGRPSPGEVILPHNLYIYEMLCSYARIMEVLGEHSGAKQMNQVLNGFGTALEQYFWSEHDGCYQTRRASEYNFHEHTQYMMLAFNLVPNARVGQVVEALCSEKLTKLSLSPQLYMLKGLLKQSMSEQAYATNMINRIYEGMLEKGASTFWETEEGSSSFGGAGSLCHAWSSIHVYYYGAYVLGVRPLEAGFRKFEVKPYTGSMSFAKGTVPTPSGSIHVKWQKNADDDVDLEIRYPSDLVPNVCMYEGAKIGHVSARSYKPASATYC